MFFVPFRIGQSICRPKRRLSVDRIPLFVLNGPAPWDDYLHLKGIRIIPA